MWRDLDEFPGYQVSSDGQVRSANGVLKPWIGSGYETVSLSVQGVVAKRRVHTLVAAAFLGPRPAGLDICHNNGIRTDNRASNLRYDSRSENILDQVRQGIHNNARKTHCPQGHEYTPDNTYIVREASRQCVACTKQKAAERHDRKKAAV